MENNYPISPVLRDEDSTAGMQKLLIEQFLMENYQFRHNELSGKVEFKILNSNMESERIDHTASSCNSDGFRPITEKAMNSILRCAEIALPELSGHKHHIELLIFSEETPTYDPAKSWLEGLPEWDGKDRVVDFFSRIPGIGSEQVYWMNVWMRSAVAHWMGIDTMHGNECVPTLIGSQGCGKSTFCQRILPACLRSFYLDHINLANKHDKEMALTSNLLVNIDELDQIRHSQHAELKQTLSKSKVNGRPIYGRSQMDRKRFASFIATTNNPHPLTDPTGSRRFICISIAKGLLIDNDSDIEYEQLYAQILNEVCEQGKRYWFTNEETLNIQSANVQFQHELDIDDMIDACFRQPEAADKVQSMSVNEIAQMMNEQYPLLVLNHPNKIRIGCALTQQGYEHKLHHNRRIYFVVPRKRMKAKTC